MSVLRVYSLKSIFQYNKVKRIEKVGLWDADGPCGIRETVAVDSEFCRGSRRFPEYMASDSQSISQPMISMESQKRKKTKDPPPYLLEAESRLHCPEFSVRP
ncbi:hypothetical protein E2C01_059447 [Portunus trituberculatus]|uniref:Uncharacterized protein n=1 Tax=Portunus trituberculatus TaxID=210409 RepID=A0A5B7H930_PORTR|nr:hypothetical protein [Portunus trituberculatus]